MAALPKSPAGMRRSSSGASLRPVLPFVLDEGTGTAVVDEDEEESELTHMPMEQPSPFSSGAGVDEVEYAYGYEIIAAFASFHSYLRFQCLNQQETIKCIPYLS